MATTVQRSYEADRVETDKDGEITARELLYLVFEAADEDAAVSAVMAEAPEKDGDGLKRRGATVEDRLAPDAWKVRVAYAPSGGDDEDDDEDPNGYTFDTGSGTMHRAVALSHIGDYAPEDGTVLDFDGAIGVDADGNVGGVDVVMPQPGFTETVDISKKHFKARYKRRLIAMTGKVNEKKFRGYAPGEVRFDGASASRNGGNWRVTFRFSVSPNAEKIEVGDIVIEGTAQKPAKEGWDYLWFSYADAETKDEAGNVVAVVRRPVCAHIERVYERGDFSQLDIPKED